MAGDPGDNRRLPRNLEGLFRFCTENTVTEDAPDVSRFEPMTDERKLWLEGVIASMQGSDPTRLMASHLQTLSSNPCTDDEVAQCEQALEQLIEHAEDIDRANDLQNIGCLSVLSRLLHNSNPTIRARSAQLVGTMVQNNPKCQEKVMEENILPTLLTVLDTDPNNTVRAKTLYAISSLCRDLPSGQDEFLALDGYSVLLRSMQVGCQVLQTKAAFMIAWLCAARPDHKDELCSMGMVEQLVGLLQAEHAAYHEHLMRALLRLVEDHPAALAESRRTEISLRQLLQGRIALLADKEEYQEEYEYSTKLYAMCFGTDDTKNQASASCVER